MQDDRSRAAIMKDKEGATPITKLLMSNKLESEGILPNQFSSSPLPFTPIENRMKLTSSPGFAKQGDHCSLSPELASHLSSTPFITVRRY